jgi:uncharacterized Zn-binding protein involved in type VI secretion
MTNIARVGDIAGGPIINGATTVTANGIPVAQLGSVVSPHGKAPHSNSVIIAGSATVLAEGIPIARLGDAATCGHVIANASPNIIAGL